MRRYVLVVVSGVLFLMVGLLVGYEWGVEVGKGVAHLSDYSDLVRMCEWSLEADDGSEGAKLAIGSVHGMVKRAMKDTRFGPNAKERLEALDVELRARRGK